MKFATMLKIMIRNLIQGPVTRKYPYEEREPFPGERGVVIMPDESKCIYCGICARKCPSNALTVTRTPEKMWKYERFRCILCGACVDTCPKKCLAFAPRSK
jgi:formate hydrogenlyase subunit 6/NADH:ubiquinone oxidoreductase subunit I